MFAGGDITCFFGRLPSCQPKGKRVEISRVRLHAVNRTHEEREHLDGQIFEDAV